MSDTMETSEWVDHSNASAVEEFNASVEDLFRKWGLRDDMPQLSTGNGYTSQRNNNIHRLLKPSSEDCTDDEYEFEDKVSMGNIPSTQNAGNINVITETIELGKDVYSLILVTSNQHANKRRFQPKDSLESLFSLAEIEILTSFTDFSLRSITGNSDIERFLDQIYQWFGIKECILSGPIGRNTNMNDISLLLSSFSIALPACGTWLPCFIMGPRKVRSNRLDDRGINWYGIALDTYATTVHFDSCREDITNVPEKLCNLLGLSELFRCKIFKLGVPKDNGRTLEPTEDTEHEYSCGSRISDNVNEAFGWPEAHNAHYDDQISGIENLKMAGSFAGHDIFIMARDGCMLISAKHSYSPRLVKSSCSVLAKVSPKLTAHARQYWADSHDDNFDWRLHLSAITGKSINQDKKTIRAIERLQEGVFGLPLWGPLKDPLDKISLQVIWPPFRENTYAETEHFSTFSPESAPVWIVRAHASDDFGSVEQRKSSMVSELVSSPLFGVHELSIEEELLESVEKANDHFSPSDHAQGAELCPLASGLWCILELLKATQGSKIRNAVLSHLRRPSTNPNPRFDYFLLQTRVAHVVRSLFKQPEDYSLDSESQLKLRNLQEEYMKGSFDWFHYRKYRSKIFEENLLDEDTCEISGSFYNRFGANYQTAKQGFRAARPSFNVLVQACPECWICSSETSFVQKTSEPQTRKTAPVGSILSLLALRMGEFGASLEGFSALWREFVSELRWHWDNLFLVPINIGTGSSCVSDYVPTCPVNHHDCILNQKLCLLNLCIGTKAHKEYGHGDFFARENSSRVNPPSISSCCDGDKLLDAECDSIRNSSLFQKKGTVHPHQQYEHFDLLSNPWTFNDCVMTEDMVHEKNEMLYTIAANSSTCSIHERMLVDALMSDMQAFKAANPGSTYDDFRVWKERSRHLGDYWKNLWESQSCVSLNIGKQMEKMQKRNKGDRKNNEEQSTLLFDPSAEAEKLLHYLETVSPKDALSQLFAIALEGAEMILLDATSWFGHREDAVKVFRVLDSHTARITAQFKHSNLVNLFSLGEIAFSSQPCSDNDIVRLENAVEAVERAEYLLSVAISLLHKLPAAVVANMLNEEEHTGQLSAALCGNQTTFEREHIKKLMFPENSDGSVAIPIPDEKEYVLRALARRPSFTQPMTESSFDIESWEENSFLRLGGNRMYACIASSTLTVATALTEISF